MTEKKKRPGRVENLKPLTVEKAREIGRKGGIASGKVKKEKKLMSQIYADFLASEYDVKIEGKVQKISGAGMVNQVMRKVLARADSASVQLMKEVRDATEGSKHSIDLTSTEEAAKEIKEIFGAALKNNNDK